MTVRRHPSPAGWLLQKQDGLPPVGAGLPANIRQPKLIFQSALLWQLTTLY